MANEKHDVRAHAYCAYQALDQRVETSDIAMSVRWVKAVTAFLKLPLKNAEALVAAAQDTPDALAERRAFEARERRDIGPLDTPG